MKPDRALSDAMFIHSFTKGAVIEFDRVATEKNLTPLSILGRPLVLELSKETTATSREKYGDHYVDFEVARILVGHGLFHLHSDILIRSDFTEMIFTTRIALYVRP